MNKEEAIVWLEARPKIKALCESGLLENMTAWWPFGWAETEEDAMKNIVPIAKAAGYKTGLDE